MTQNSNAGPGADSTTLRLHFDRFPGFVEEYRSLISLGGMFLKTGELRPVGSQVAFDLRLADGFRLVHGSGEVVWVRPTSQGPDQEAGIAVRFQALDEKGRELVLKILEEQVKGGGTPFDVDEVPAGVVATPGEPAAAPPVAAPPPAAAGESPGDSLEFSTPWEKLPEVPMDVLDEGGDLGAAATPAAPAAPGAASADGSFELPPISPPLAPPSAGVDLEPPEIAFDAVDFDAAPLDADDDEPTFVGSAVDLEPRPEEPAAAELSTTDAAFETGAFDGAGLSPAADTSLETGAFDGSALESPTFDDGPTFELEPEPVGSEPLGLSDPPGVPDFGTPSTAEAGVVDVRDTTRERTPVDPMPTADVDTGEMDFGTGGASEGVWEPTPGATPGQADAPSGVGFGDAAGFAPESFTDGASAEAGGQDFASSADAVVDPATFDAGGGFDLGSAPGAAFQDSGPAAPSFDAAAPPEATPAPSFDLGPPAETPAPAFDAPAGGFDPAPGAVPSAMPEVSEPATFGSPSFDSPAAAPAGAPAAGVPAAGVPESFDPVPPASGGLFDNPSPSGGLFGGAPGSTATPGESTEVLAEGAAPLAPTMPAFGASEEPAVESTLSLDPPAHDDRYGFADYEEDLDGTAPKKSRGPMLRLALIGVLVLAVVGGYFFKDTLLGLAGLGGPSSDAVVASGPPPGGAGQRPGPRPGAGTPAATDPGAAGETPGSGDPTSPDAVDETAPGTQDPMPDGADGGADLATPASGAGTISADAVDTTPAPRSAPPPERATPPPPVPEPVPPPVVTPPPPTRDTGPRRANAGGGSVVESITWSEGLRGTEVEIRLDGPVRADRVGHDLLGYKATVEQVRIAGVFEDYFPATVDVGTAVLERVRVGLHDGGGESEIRLVFDFPEPGPAIREVRVDGPRVLIQVR